MDNKKIFGTVVLIVGVLGVYKIAQKFGIIKDATDIKEDENEQQGQIVGSAWHRDYWQQFNWSEAKKNSVYNVALPAAKILKNDVFGIFYDDFDKGFAQIKKFTTKAEISFLVDVFAYEYEKDLFTWLKDGRSLVAGSGFSVNNLNKIVNYVNGLKNN